MYNVQLFVGNKINVPQHKVVHTGGTNKNMFRDEICLRRVCIAFNWYQLVCVSIPTLQMQPSGEFQSGIMAMFNYTNTVNGAGKEEL